MYLVQLQYVWSRRQIWPLPSREFLAFSPTPAWPPSDTEWFLHSPTSGACSADRSLMLQTQTHKQHMWEKATTLCVCWWSWGVRTRFLRTIWAHHLIIMCAAQNSRNYALSISVWFCVLKWASHSTRALWQITNPDFRSLFVVAKWWAETCSCTALIHFSAKVRRYRW